MAISNNKSGSKYYLERHKLAHCLANINLRFKFNGAFLVGLLKRHHFNITRTDMKYSEENIHRTKYKMHKYS